MAAGRKSPLTRQSPPNYLWYYRKRYKQIQNSRALGPFPNRRPPVILIIQRDETTWYGVLVTIIMRQILHRHRQEKHVGLH